jgi:hypothetical protein
MALGFPVVTACALALAAAPSLRGVVHADKARHLPAEARAALARDGSVVLRGTERHFFSLYDRNVYQGVPSFVTLDALLHVFHVRFDDVVARMEEEVARPALIALAARQTQAALALFPAQGPPEERVRLLALFHAVPLALADRDGDPDPRLRDDVEQEVARLRGPGLVTTPLCPRPMDTGRFHPRGHYVRWNLEPYFRATTFYAECRLDLADPAQLSRALDLARLLDAPSRGHLETVRAVSSWVVGPADDPGLHDVAALLPSPPPPLPQPLLPAHLAEAARRVPDLRPPTVPAQATPGERGRPELRVLGGGGVPDAALFARTTVVPGRPWPGALDVLAALGSEDARTLLAGDMARHPAMAEALAAPLHLDGHGLYGQWLALLGRVVRPPPAGRAAFETTPAWQRHLTVAGAASWAELRHDTLLYVKAPIVMMQGGHGDSLPASQAAGYVEPRPDVYAQMRALVAALRPMTPPGRARDGLEALDDLVTFVTSVAELEVAGQPFPRAVDVRLRTIGSELERLTRGRADELPDQALVADVHAVATPDGQVSTLMAGTGDVDEVWVIVPRAGKRLLTRGGVFSYHEFVQPPGERLDDRGWLRLLRTGAAPPRPPWASPLAPAPGTRRSRD